MRADIVGGESGGDFSERRSIPGLDLAAVTFVSCLQTEFSLLCSFITHNPVRAPTGACEGSLHFARSDILRLRFGVVPVQRLPREYGARHNWPKAERAAALFSGRRFPLFPVLPRTLHRQQDGMVEGVQLDPRDGQAGLRGLVGRLRRLCRHA